jgi:hypothetical protein
MATKSAIEWTESTWNPLTGCTKISPGCQHCYAERVALRLQAMGQPNYANGFKLTLHEQALDLPLHWKKPQTIFVNSMSDLFHKYVPVDMQWAALDIPDPETPVGARGIGEPPVGGGCAAILNALSDALGDEIFRRAPVNADTILTSLEAGRPMQNPLMAHI